MKLRLGLLLILLIVLLMGGCSKNETQPQSYKPATLATKIDFTKTSTISGVVSFDGTLPKPQPIDMSQDPACVTGKVPPNFGEAYAGKNGGLQNVYVYIKDGLGNYVCPPQEAEIIVQHGCRYDPHVVGIMVGQKLHINNEDPALHNIHVMPHDNDGWNESQYPGGDAIEKTFSKPELMIPVQCNNHPWMKMYVNVSAHPYFDITNSNGHFSFGALPPGTYTLAAIHEKMGEKTMQFTVGPKEEKIIDFKFSAADMK